MTNREKFILAWVRRNEAGGSDFSWVPNMDEGTASRIAGTTDETGPFAWGEVQTLLTRQQAPTASYTDITGPENMSLLGDIWDKAKGGWDKLSGGSGPFGGGSQIPLPQVPFPGGGSGSFPKLPVSTAGIGGGWGGVVKNLPKIGGVIGGAIGKAGGKVGSVAGAIGKTRGGRMVMEVAGGFMVWNGLEWVFSDTKPRKRPTMNVLNPRALTRANRRVDGFACKARPILRELGFTVSSTRKLSAGKKSGKKKSCR